MLSVVLRKKEVTSILQQRLLNVEGKIRTDKNKPAGFIDFITN